MFLRSVAFKARKIGITDRVITRVTTKNQHLSSLIKQNYFKGCVVAWA